MRACPFCGEVQADVATTCGACGKSIADFPASEPVSVPDENLGATPILDASTAPTGHPDRLRLGATIVAAGILIGAFWFLFHSHTAMTPEDVVAALQDHWICAAGAQDSFTNGVSCAAGKDHVGYIEGWSSDIDIEVVPSHEEAEATVRKVLAADVPVYPGYHQFFVIGNRWIIWTSSIDDAIDVWHAIGGRLVCGQGIDCPEVSP